MSKQKFGRTFSSLEEFAAGFGEAFIEATDKATAEVRRQERERKARTVTSGVTFVPAPVEPSEPTNWQRLREERKAEEAVVAENQRVAARAMAQVAKRSGMSDAARKSRMGRLA